MSLVLHYQSAVSLQFYMIVIGINIDFYSVAGTMDGVVYKLPPGVPELAHIWDTQESAIRRHLLDVDTSDPYLSSGSRPRVSHFKNLPSKPSLPKSKVPIHHVVTKETHVTHSEPDLTKLVVEEPTFHTSETATCLPDPFIQLLLEAEHAIHSIDCIESHQLPTHDVTLQFPDVGMSYQDDVIDSCLRTSTGEPPLVTVRPYERHWKRSGVYQWRKPAYVRPSEVVERSVKRRSRVKKGRVSVDVKLKKPRIPITHHESTLLDLPNELIHLILSYLPLPSLLSAATACKRLSLLANSPFLYSHLNLSRMSLSSDNLNWIITKQPKHLDLTNSIITLTDSQTDTLIQHIAPNIQSLSLYPGTPYSLKGDQICHLLSRHDTLYLTSLHLNWVGVTDYGLSCLQSLNDITTLSLTGSNHITDQAIIPILVKFQHTLTNLDLSSCIQLTNKTGYVVATCAKLSSLGLATCYKMTDKVFKLLLASLPLLQHLDLHFNPALAETNPCVLEGLTNCCNLKRLNLNHATNVTDSYISHLLIKLTTLEHLCVGNCKLTDKFMTSLCQARLPNLSHLDLSGLPISSLSLSALSSTYQHTLTSLVLNSCIRVTQNIIRKLIEKCTRLETLSVFNTNITPVPRYLIKSKVQLIGTTPLSRNPTH